MRFWLRAALLALVCGAAACSGRAGGLLGPEYEYEEDLTLALDGSATLVVNASVPALQALRGLPLDVDLSTRTDIVKDRVRAIYSSPESAVQRVSTWTRYGRRFVGVRLAIPDIRNLSKAPPFSWEHFELYPAGEQMIYRDTVGPANFRPGSLRNVGWKGNEVVAFRLHLPARILYHNSRDLVSNAPRGASRGNILTWEQLLTDRLEGKPIGWSDTHTPGVLEARMDRQSILYRTLWLFGLAFAAALIVLAGLIWFTVKKGRDGEGSLSRQP